MTPIIGICFLLIIIYLIKVEFFSKKQIKKPQFILNSILKGFILYAIIGYIVAYFIIASREPLHPHSMIGLLYLFYPLFASCFGIILGLLLALKFKNKIHKGLFIGAPFVAIALAIPFL